MLPELNSDWSELEWWSEYESEELWLGFGAMMVGLLLDFEMGPSEWRCSALECSELV